MEFSLSRGRVRLLVQVHRQGEDLLVQVQGGDTPHLGAVALACGEYLQVLSYGTHRDGEVAGPMAQRLAGGTRRAVAVSAGIHLDQITKAEIAQVLEMAQEAVDSILLQWVVPELGPTGGDGHSPTGEDLANLLPGLD